MIIYAIEGAIIYSDNSTSAHKQGRVHENEPLTVKRQPSPNWFVIERPAGLYLGDDPNPLPDPAYPAYWVRLESISFDPIGEPVPEPEPLPEPVPTPEPSNLEERVAVLEQRLGELGRVIDAILTILGWMGREDG